MGACIPISNSLSHERGETQKIDILAIVPFGYPAKAIGKGQKKRKPLGEIAYRERWGQPFV